MAKLSLNEALSREIRKAMIDADIDYGQIGEGSVRAWRYRIDQGNMRNDDFFYLCSRLHVSPDELIRRAITSTH